MNFPRTRAQTLLVALLVLMVCLSALVLASDTDFDFFPAWADWTILGATGALLVLTVHLSKEETHQWESAHGLQPADGPGALARGMASSKSQEWSDRDDPQALVGEHRGRKVALYQCDWTIPAPSDHQGTYVVTIAIAGLDVPMPLIEVESGPGLRKQPAFGRWAKKHRDRAIPAGVTVRCDDDAYVSAVLPLILEQFPKDDDLYFGAAIDGPRVVVWGNLKDLLLETACDIADGLPKTILKRFRVKT